jgi:hypothetical protein
LMSDPNTLVDFYGDYLVAAAKGGVEPLPDQVYGLDAIGIGRIRGLF